MPDSAAPDPVAQLCPACGLCCNGVLFGDVELQPHDDAKLLTARGVELEKKGRKLIFQQPCACFTKGLCAVYSKRPSHCRAFECGVLTRVREHKMTTAAALRLIQSTREKAGRVLTLVRALGNQDERLSLTQRYKQVLSEPTDLTDPGGSEQRGRLLRAMNRLMDVIHREFLR